MTRRVYRDGNSEYLLNKTPCRLRDIQSLFADTGVGRSAYSIMEQGKIDLILSSRPEDRRTVFEEAAGITKYKTQKSEALRKLEATEANLLRIGDIIKEVKRQIGSLQRQAGKGAALSDVAGRSAGARHASFAPAARSNWKRSSNAAGQRSRAWRKSEREDACQKSKRARTNSRASAASWMKSTADRRRARGGAAAAKRDARAIAAGSNSTGSARRNSAN